MTDAISVVRTEKKYHISEATKSSLISSLSMVMKRDRYGDEKGYRVRSLYFDSIYDDDLQDKIDGLELRKKIRIRIYDPDQKQAKLELKQKQGAAQRKKSMWITRELAEQMIRGEYYGLLELDNILAKELYTVMECGIYRPKCIVEYDRLAFMDETNNTRVTIDSNVRVGICAEKFFSPDLILNPVSVQPILEIKYNRFLMSFIKDAVKRANASEVAISKYVMCRQAVR